MSVMIRKSVKKSVKFNKIRPGTMYTIALMSGRRKLVKIGPVTMSTKVLWSGTRNFSKNERFKKKNWYIVSNFFKN